ncbi:MAG TPA: hypothetical protein VIS51_03925 [Solirubrobacterales bacterium]
MASATMARRPVAPSRMEPEQMKRIQTAQAAMEAYQPIWRLALAFFDQHQYAEINAKTARVTELETAEGSEEKPRWVSRATRNRYTSGIVRECAALTSRAPVWECTPRGSEYRQDHLAKLGEQALLYAYDEYELDTLATGLMITAANCGASYLWPYFDSQVGPQLGHAEGDPVYRGDLAFEPFQPDEVMWEPGYRFPRAPVHIIKRAYPAAQVMDRDGYVGPDELKPDARAQSYEFGTAGASESKESVFVYEWLERPCAKHPDGRWISCLQTGEIVQRERRYPRDAKRSQGKPCLHEFAWLRRQHRHRPLGAGEQAIDIQRTRNATINSIIMWKNLVLNPRLLAPMGSLLEEVVAKPGLVIEYRPVGGMRPEWETVQDIPGSLFQTLAQCDDDMAEILGTWAMPDTESAQHLQTAIERDRERRALQAKEMARSWSGLGTHIIELMQEFFLDERLITIEGRFSVERVPDFKGSEIPALNVRVAPGTIEARTRAAQDALVWQLFQMGQVPFHQAMAALNAGSAQKIIDGYELQIAKQAREIDEMTKLGDESAMDLPDPESAAMVYEAQGHDPVAAATMANEQLLGSILELGPQVEEQDDHEVHYDVLSQYMVTVDFERQPEIVQGVMRAHLASHKQAMVQAQMAESGLAQQAAIESGETNASRPALEKPQPSEPSLASQKQGLS